MEPTDTAHLTIPAGATTATAKQAGPFFTPAVTMWAVLAVLAAGYLAVLAIKPGAIAAYLPSATSEDNEGARATTALSDTQDLRDNVEQLQVDVAKIKTELSQKSEQDKALATRLAVLEETKRGGPALTAAALPATAPGTAKTALAPVADTSAGAAGIPNATLVPAAPAPTTAAAKAAAKKAATAVAKAVSAPAPAVAITQAPVSPVVPAAAPAPLAAVPAAAVIAPPLATATDAAVPTPAGVKLINAPLSASSAASRAAPAPVAVPAAAQPAVAPANAAETLAPKFETGSVQNLGVAPAPAATGAKLIGIYIGSGPSVDSLRLSWSLLSDRNAESLKALEPRYTTGIDANGLNYGLVAGPLRSVADAQKLCKDLAAKAVTCRVGDFTGEAL